MNNKKIKGFTLVELIVVIAILVVLMGIMSLVISGYRRDAKLETMNENAKIVFTAFQDILIDCEINQDLSMFDAYDYKGDAGDLKAAWVFFRISDKDYDGRKMDNPGSGLGDEIHINTMYEQNAFHGMGGGPLTGLSVWKYGPGTGQNVSGNPGYNDVNYSVAPCSGPAGVTTDGGAHIWNKINKAVTGRIDPKMEGTYCVQVDLENYEVKSVVCRDLGSGGRDPKTGLWDDGEINNASYGTKNIGGIVLKEYKSGSTQCVVNYDWATPIGGTDTRFPLGMAFVKNLQAEQIIYRETGVTVGAYPFFDNVYSAGHN